MARDSNGNYSLPNGSIVASGDTILPSQHNPALSDIASSLTNSLSRAGQGGMLADLNLGGFGITNGGTITSTGFVATNGSGKAELKPSGDIYAARSDGTGVIYFRQDGARYLYWDGTNYQFVGAGLNAPVMRVNGDVVWHAGNLSNPASLNGAAFLNAISAPTASFPGGVGSSVFNVGADWSISTGGGRLIISYQGVAKFSFDGGGVFRGNGNVIANTAP